MNIVPLLKCNNMKESVEFYTTILDFKHIGTWPDQGEATYSILTRQECELHLSSFSGDGVFGNVAIVLINDIDELFDRYLKRGLDTLAKKDSPVHQGPLNQTWGTREFYVDDPNGNTIRFIQR